MKKIRIAIILSLGVILILLGAGYAIINRGHSAYDDLTVLYPVPEFRLFEGEDDPFTRADLLGHINVVDFVFTNCQGPCPIMSVKMQGIYEEFKDAEDLQIVSISVDPDRDSFEVLQDYAKGLGVRDDRWKFIRGPIKDVTHLCEDGFKLAAEDLPWGHTVKFILVDGNGDILGYYDGTNDVSVHNLKKHLKRLLS